MLTLDGYVVREGLRVWDYDLERGWIDMSRVRTEINEETGESVVWFDVVRDSGGRKLMSNTRVWVFHPSTWERA